MKKILVYLICWICIIELASASVVINQVLYNPENTESGAEAVELYNNGNNDIDISGWKLATESTLNDAVIPENTVICAGCYYLIADEGWSNSKDNQTWADADLEEPISLYNANSGAAIIQNETIVDAVGWGNPDEISNDLFEGTPANGAEEGKSLLRIDDTDNNINDFTDSEPFFRSSSDLGTGKDSKEIMIEFDVTNTTVQDNSVSIDLINISEGRHIMPVPGGRAEITLNVQLTGQNIDNVTATLVGETAVLSKIKEVNATTSVFSGILSLEHCMPPGDYSIEIKANDEKASISFEYEELVAIELDKTAIDFGEIETEKAYYNEIKIRNVGNKVVDIGLKGIVDCNYLYYTFNNDYNKLSTSTIIKNIDLNYGSNSEALLKLKITANNSTTTGEYQTSIEITAVGSEN